MLFEGSEEAPGQPGLGIFEGDVRHFSAKHGLKIPQIGWNTVTVRQPDAPALAGISTGEFVYFVHSYHPVPRDPTLIALETNYGETFASAVARDNLVATQFHPEKSQRAGLQMFRNFVALSEKAASLIHK
jgi:imidazole glycerol phosphate synthase glutamine amidotransferase subunit